MAEYTVRRTSSLRLAVLALAVASAASAPAMAEEDSSANLTYSRDIAPILREHCVECHRPGQIGPMSLRTYDEARPWAKSIRKAVAEGSMPPWHADFPRGVFANERVLAPEEVARVLAWVDAGAPRGEEIELAAQTASAPEPPGVWRMGEPDQIFTMPADYAVPDDLEDRYVTFRVPTGLAEDRWVSSVEVRPGAFDVVHHILIFVAPHGGEGFSGEGSEGEVFGTVIQGLTSGKPGAGLFAKYAPGGHPEVFAKGYARLLPKGSDLLFQVHYHKQRGPGTGRVDRSSLAVRYAPASARRPITTAWIMNPIFRIPPGEADHKATAYFLFVDDGRIHALAPHMHVRGTSFRYEARYPDGRKETLLNVPRWDFNWQTSYIFKEPKRIPAGTVIRAVAHWDNSLANRNNPDPAKSVRFGEATTDEMMIGFMDYSYDHAPELQAQIGLPGEIGPAVKDALDGLASDLRKMLRDAGRKPRRGVAAAKGAPSRGRGRGGRD